MEEQAGPWQVVSERRMESSRSTPYVSASCSPRRSTDRSAFCCYSSVNTPSCPTKIACNSSSLLPSAGTGFSVPSSDASFSDGVSAEDFEFSARFSDADPSWSLETMSTADELFCNGQIRPLWSTGKDFTPVSPQLEPDPDEDDDDNHYYDFKSSADYKFSMSSTLHSSASVINTTQRCAGYGYNGASHDDNSVCSHDWIQRMKEEEEAQRMKGFVQKWKEAYARQGREEMPTKQVTRGKAEESRGRRACGNKEGGVRRTRSLSPLRVFHMDDELPKQSFDGSFHSTEGDGGNEGKEEQGIKPTSSNERRFTLKELLHSSSRTESMPRQKHRGKLQRKADMDMELKMRERRALRIKSSPKHSSGYKSVEGSSYGSHHRPVQLQESMSPHGLHYKPQKVHMEQVRQQTSLPYKHGLLGCLGFSSRSYGSIGGIQTFGIGSFQFKHGGTRRSAR